MKRSRINRIIAEARETFQDYRCKLPPWAFWGPQDWDSVGEETDEIGARKLKIGVGILE